MEIDENLKYTLYVPPRFLTSADVPPSLQFDPAPRAGEPLVSRRVPDVRPPLPPSLSILTVGVQYFL